MLERFLFYFKHSLNDLRVNKQRTFFALLSIAAGVAAVVSLQTLGVMIEDSLTGNLRESNRGDIRISMDEFGTDVNETRRENDGIIEPLDNDEGYRISENGLQVLEDWVAENYQGDYTFSYRQSAQDSIAAFSIGVPEKDRSKTFMLPYVVETDNYPLFGEVNTEDGQALASVLNEPTDIVISRNLADELDAEVGDTVRVSGANEDFTLRGIAPTDSETGFQNFFGSIVGYYYLDVRSTTLFDDMTPNTAQEVYIGLDDPTATEEIGDALQREYFYLNVATTVELEEDNEALASAVNDMVTIMGLISMLIGGIGIVNTMLVVVNRRTVEVAVLKTLGLEPEEVTTLFLIEAALMGVVGSLLGIVLGWVMAYALQDIAGRFVAQSLGFKIAWVPARNGFIIGVLVTTIFGFLPTLAAGQVRPASVLRPSEAVVPKSGRLQSFAALVIVLLALSLVAQGFIGELLGIEGGVTGANGAILGFLLAIPIIIGGVLSMAAARRGRSWALRIFLWLFILIALPAGGFAFGYFVPAIIVLTSTFILAGSLYLLLLLLIWALGGGRIQEFPVIGPLPAIIRIPLFLFCPLWVAFLAFVIIVLKPGETGLLIFLGVLFWIHIPAIIVTLTLPAWVIGQVVQRFTFLDLKVALRAMVANKARGASTLLALVIGIFTLSLLTMLVGMVNAFISDLLADQEGGNVLIFPAAGGSSIQLVEDTLDGSEGVNSFRADQLL